MEELREITYQFFHSELFLIILGASLVSSIITFRSYMIKRAEKNEKERQEKGITLFLAAGLPFLGWAFYSMSFHELGFDMLNLVVAVTFSLFLIAGLIAGYDRWRMGQKTLDRFTYA